MPDLFDPFVHILKINPLIDVYYLCTIIMTLLVFTVKRLEASNSTDISRKKGAFIRFVDEY